METSAPREPRAIDPSAFLPRAAAAARQIGVTRLADVTRLDRPGLPVFQAIRPAGRSLSVHQGKGISAAAAKVGALMEAIECWHAEQFEGAHCRARFSELPEHERAPQFDDYCRHRGGCEEEGRTLAWCAAEDLGSGGQLYIPELLISLDYTRGLDSEIQRVSDGLASGGTPAEATLHGLYELIERDAVGEWMRAGFIGRSSTFVDPCWNWLHAWRHRLGALDLEGTLFRVPALAGLPVYLFQVRDRSPRGGAAWGSGCHDLAELAAFKAMAEALQSRLTLIAGARDDIIQEDFAACTGAGLGIRPPGPAAAQAQEDGGLGTGEAAVAELVRRLVALGYRQVGRVDLGRADIGIAVAKMFVPGLGSLSRERRLP